MLLTKSTSKQDCKAIYIGSLDLAIWIWRFHILFLTSEAKDVWLPSIHQVMLPVCAYLHTEHTPFILSHISFLRHKTCDRRRNDHMAAHASMSVEPPGDKLRSRVLIWIANVNIPIVVVAVIVFFRVVKSIRHVRSGDAACLFGSQVIFLTETGVYIAIRKGTAAVLICTLCNSIYIMYDIISKLRFIICTRFANGADPDSKARV